MRFLFASEFRHLPQKFGGVQSNTHELARALVRGGHSAAVAAELLATDFLGIRTRLLGKITPKGKVHDSFLGYSTYRRWSVLDSLPELVAEVQPDIVIVQPLNQIPLARELARLAVPTIVYIHDVEWPILGGDPRDVGQMLFLSNSTFTAEQLHEKFGLESTVLTPTFLADDYRTARRPQNVTMINPHALKGGDLAIRIASDCPEIPFCFVRSWDLPQEQEQLISNYAKLHRNLMIKRPTRNMRDVYARAKIILMPSRCEEAWGRVASEAHFSGIPVVASNRGGLPEAVGPGGILLDPDGPIEPWVEAVRRLWHDEPYYAGLSTAALAYSKRAQLDPNAQIDALLAAADRAIRQQAVSRDSAMPSSVA